MSLINAPGSDLYYEEKGEGVPILLIHGGGATASTWGRAVDSIAEVGRVVTYDRRGYGRSGGDPVAYLAESAEKARAAEIEACGKTVGKTAPAKAVPSGLRRPRAVLGRGSLGAPNPCK